MWLSLMCLCMGFLNPLNIKVVLNIFVVRGFEFDLLLSPKLYLPATLKNKKRHSWRSCIIKPLGSPVQRIVQVYHVSDHYMPTDGWKTSETNPNQLIDVSDLNPCGQKVTLSRWSENAHCLFGLLIDNIFQGIVGLTS